MSAILMDGYLGYIQLTEKDYMLNEGITPQRVTTFVTKQINGIENKLKKFGVNVSQIKRKAKSMVPMLKREYEAGKSIDEVSKILMKAARQTVISYLTKAKHEIAEFGVSEKIILSLAGFIIILFINSFLLSFASAFLNPQLALNITAIVVAPMVEEAVKNYFIQMNMPWIGTSIVFGIEAIMYIMTLASKGLNIPKTVIVRLVSLLMHFTTTYIQKKVIESSKSEIDKSQKIFTAWIIGVGIHASWNIFATIMNDEISAWAS